ncbi:CHAT domain-containing protein [Vacuolonema iberomarrocanum]|uniref:CHAT domain-containing protein n=1 Tax=Vacuolonema iberomarrocanum TaxID=3454632 RepID=UPI003F6DF734
MSFTKTILILSANPRGTDPLRLDEEVREIEEGIQRSRYRDTFIIQHKTAVRPRDVQRAMLDFKPQIVHFCGHGTGDAGLILEDESGKVKPVRGTALANLFELFSRQVECVLLNACYSEVQAKEIANHIPYVIGMNQSIGDRAAIEFATSFYDALGAGRTVEFAFKLGKNAMQLAGIAEDQTPVLLSGGSGQTPSKEKRSRIFISYKRGVSPDEAVAMEVYHA